MKQKGHDYKITAVKYYLNLFFLKQYNIISSLI